VPQPIENELSHAIKSGELVFRPFRLTSAPAPKDLQELGFTGVLTAERATRELRFGFQCTRAWTRLGLQEFLRAAEQLRGHTDLQPLLVTSYLSGRQIDELDEAGVSGIDLAGNGLLQAPPAIYVRNTGAARKHKLRAPPTYVYRSWKLAALVPRLLLVQPFFSTVQSVLDTCHARMMPAGSPLPLTLPTVSKALSQLEQDLAITRNGREVQLLHPGRLLDNLARAYKQPVTTASFRGRTALTPDQAWDILRKLRPELRVVVTGRGSAPLYTDLAGTGRLQLYVSDASQVAAALKAQTTESFPNLELLETAEEGVYFDATTDAHATWSSIVQTYLELAVGGAREVEAAKELRTQLILLQK
jgi:hypothetical protein